MNLPISNLESSYFEMDKVLMQQPHKAKFEQYKHERNFKLMFQYLWGLKEAHSILNVDIKPPLKSEALSEDLRKQGNKSYQKKDFQQALDKYNMSIMVAPHPDITKGEYSAEFSEYVENHDAAKYKVLALGYANRSAVLYELKQYRKSITDIDCALKFGYPKNLHFKLAERKAKCLIALKKHQEAKTLLQTAIASLSSLKVADARKSLEKLEASCLTGSTVSEQHTSDETYEDHSPRNLSLLSNDELRFAYKNPPPPILEDVNPTIPAFSSALGLTYSEYSGKSVVATRDIKPGELIGVEAPYVSTTRIFEDRTNLRNFCCVCFARCLTPLPCTHCNMVIFCSDSCRSEGISKFHKVECSVFPTLLELDVYRGTIPITAYRILAQIPFPQLKSMIPKLEEERHQKPRQLHGFNDQGVYDSSDYKTVFHLEENVGIMGLDELIRMCCIAFLETKLLIKSTCYFVDERGKSFEPSLSDIILVGSTIFMHFPSIQVNSIVINENQVCVDKKTHGNRLYGKNLGMGVYSALSLFNHSCNCSATMVSYGNHKAIYSLGFIPEGTEVSICYLEKRFCDLSLEVRRSKMLQYNFICNCEACTNNWPTYSYLKGHPKLKQSGKMILRGATGKMAELYPGNRREIVSYMRKLGDNFLSGVNLYDSPFSDAIYSFEFCSLAIEVLEFIGRFANMPCQLGVGAQEVLSMGVLNIQGSCNYFK